MNVYTVAFAFCGDSVLLIRKAKPEWQKGLLNGIGGKVELNENVYNATVREFCEETGLWNIIFHPLIYHVDYWDKHESRPASLVYFSAFEIEKSDALTALNNTRESAEPCVLWPISKIGLGLTCIYNIPYLLIMAHSITCCTPEERKIRQPRILPIEVYQRYEERGI